MGQNSRGLDDFHTFVTTQQAGHTHWLDIYPVEENLGTLTDETGGIAFVDVGGASGSENNLLRSRFPDLSGRMILQDLEHNIKIAPTYAGFETMVHEFFTPQPVKGRLKDLIEDIRLLSFSKMQLDPTLYPN